MTILSTCKQNSFNSMWKTAKTFWPNVNEFFVLLNVNANYIQMHAVTISTVINKTYYKSHDRNMCL